MCQCSLGDDYLPVCALLVVDEKDELPGKKEKLEATTLNPVSTTGREKKKRPKAYLLLLLVHYFLDASWIFTWFIICVYRE